MLKARLFLIFCFTVSLLYTQQNKLSIETNSSAYPGWETYFSYNSIPSIAEGVNEIYFASYNSIFSYNIFNSQIEKFDTLNELSRSPMFNGRIKSVGPRYCPSIEDKIHW